MALEVVGSNPIFHPIDPSVSLDLFLLQKGLSHLGRTEQKTAEALFFTTVFLPLLYLNLNELMWKTCGFLRFC